MRFQVLGPVQVFSGQQAVVISAPRQRTLLAALLTARGRTVSADRLITELWPEGAPPTAATALLVHLSALRRVLGPRLRTTPPGYTLAVAAEEVDASRFEAILGEVRGSRSPSSRDLEPALRLWRGPAFDGDRLGPMAAAEAVRLGELRRTARQEWGTLALAEGRHTDVVTEVSALIEADPTAEAPAGQLMLALHRAGWTAAAVAVYDRLRDELLQRLGALPGEELTALLEAIRRRDPALDRAPDSIPAAPNRLIGRRAELDRAATVLGEVRLVSVVGPGGCGKTRFAYQLARECSPRYPGGVHVAELAGYRDHGSGSIETVAGRIRTAVGARETPEEDPITGIARRMNDSRALLVLDNCEHARAACAAVVHELLAACPALKILTTSREALGLHGESVFGLAGLAVPPPEAPPAGVWRYDAVRLLAERAAAARGGSALRAEETPAAAELCRRLDGIPLALELAAARLRVLSISEVVSRLDRSLDLLVGSAPQARQQTVRATIDWSYDLLDHAQQVALRRLSVFAGSFEPAAAASVVGDVELLYALAERSLVERVDLSGFSRFRLNAIVRQYAAERLARDGEPGEAHAAQRGHATYFAAMLAVPPPPDGLPHATWLARMGADHDDIRAALAWTLDWDDSGKGLSIATSMWWYWWVTGQMTQGRAWLARGLAAAAPSPATPSAARDDGDLAEARHLGGAVAAHGHRRGTAPDQRDHDASLEFGFELLALAEADGNERATAMALYNTAGTLRCVDRLDEAYAQYARGLTIFARLGNRRGEAAAWTSLATIDRRQGRPALARERYLRSLRHYADLGIDEGELDAVEGLAHLDAIAGNAERALHLLAVAARERARIGVQLCTPDEVADRERAEVMARAVASPGVVARAHRSARSATLRTVVRSLLEPA